MRVRENRTREDLTFPPLSTQGFFSPEYGVSVLYYITIDTINHNKVLYNCTCREGQLVTLTLKDHSSSPSLLPT